MRAMSRSRALLLDARAVRTVAVVKLWVRLTGVSTGVAPLCHPVDGVFEVVDTFCA